MQAYSAEHIILQKLTGQTSLSDADIYSLKEIINDHPYFGAAYFLLSKKLHLQNDNASENSAQKTALHFQNPLWLYYYLLQQEETEILQPLILPAFKEQVFAAEKNEVHQQIPEQNIETTEIPLAEKAVELPDLILDDDIIKAENITAEEEIFFAQQLEETAIAAGYSETEKNEIDAPAKTTDSGSRLSSMIEQQLKEFNKQVEENAEIPVANETYYRVDYFASQGIKLKNENEEQDKLDSRLRSFTGWLKQMKKINNQPIDLGTTQADELAVQTQAEYSNEGAGVLTEAMADILIMQGKPGKAIAVYEKLSFLDPSKSFYFATKILQLKDNLK